MSTRDFPRPPWPERRDGGEYARRERFERERSLRHGRDQSGGPDDPYGIYRPARGTGRRAGGNPDTGGMRAPGFGGHGRDNGLGGNGRAGTTTIRPGGPYPPPVPGGPAPNGPRHGGGGGGSGGGFVRRFLRGPWTWRRIAAIAGIVFGSGAVLVAALVALAYSKTPIPSAVSQAALQQESVVYFSNGKSMVGTFGSTDREILTDNQIPAVVRNAVLAAEDRGYYTEGGVSITGTLRAVVNDLSGGSTQGGSTITQQFVRNYYANIGTQQTLSRKLKEIFVAMKLARQKSKAWILTQYLNTIYLGNGAYGVGAAAQAYFGVPAGKLTVSQAAAIAAIIQSPSYYPTAQGRPALIARWHYVLQGMVTMGNLPAAQAAAARFPKFSSSPQLGNGWRGYNGYIMQAVQSELENTYHFKPGQLTGGGLRIYTTFDKAKMDAIYRAVRVNEKLMRGGGRALPWYAHVGAVLEQPGTGAIVAMYSGPGYNAANCIKIKCQFDMALQNRVQVGSSFKPYVLAEARAEGMSVKTSVLDGYSPLCVPSDMHPMTYAVRASSSTARCPATAGAMAYNVSNDQGDGSLGPVTVTVATAASLNTAYTDLLHRVTTQKVIDLAREFGVNVGDYPGGSNLQHMVHQVGIALGQASLTVEEQATTFNTLAANGEYVSPHVIDKIVQGGVVTRAKLVRREVLTPDVASDVNYALSYDVKAGGTATNAAMPDGREIIGKTGTTNAAQSAFFIGAIPQYTLAVGIFSNDQDGNRAHESLNLLGGLAGGGYGGDWPAMIWRTFAEGTFAPLPAQNFPAPNFGGVKWNLIGPLMPSRQRHRVAGPRSTCGPLNYFCTTRHRGHRSSPSPCLPGVIMPGCPTPTPIVSPSPTVSPLPTSPQPGPTHALMFGGFAMWGYRTLRTRK